VDLRIIKGWGRRKGLICDRVGWAFQNWKQIDGLAISMRLKGIVGSFSKNFLRFWFRANPLNEGEVVDPIRIPSQKGAQARVPERREGDL